MGEPIPTSDDTQAVIRHSEHLANVSGRSDCESRSLACAVW